VIPRKCPHKIYSRAIHNLFLGKPVPRLPVPLHDHLKTCAACRATFSTLAMADRTLGESCGVTCDVSPLEIDMLFNTLADKLDLPPPARGVGPMRYLLPIGTAVLVVLIGLFIGWQLIGNQSDGKEYMATRGQELHPSVQIMCITTDEQATVRPARSPSGSDVCRLDETLGFSYLNPGGDFDWLSLFAIGDEDEVLWYLPNPVEPEAFRITKSNRHRAIPRTVRLSVNHRPGKYILVVLFSRQPFSFGELKEKTVEIARGNRQIPGTYMNRRTLRIDAE